MVRYFTDFAADPYYNMAFDEWMFERVLDGHGSFYLRLYGWARPAITFGFNQVYERAVDCSRLGNLPVIRRVTGGRALLHDSSELTYSLAVKLVGGNAAPAGSPRELSVRITDMLMNFLSSLGIECDYVRQSSAQNARREFFHKAPCFESLARHEIVSHQRKIIASAQRRVYDTLFQHGSIKIGGLAAHPAIPLRSPERQYPTELEPISEQTFGHMEHQFALAFERWLNGRTQPSDVAECERGDVLRRLQYVRKNCLARRDIFKQK